MYDLIVIGAGPGGYVAAAYAAKRGMKVCLVHRGEWGGNCLHWGCIPTKALLHDAGEGSPFQKMFERKNRLVMRLARGVEALIKNAQVDVRVGQAELVWEENIPSVKVSEEILKTKRVLLATGSQPNMLNFKNSQNVLSSDGVLSLKECPTSICVLGSGAVGVEFANFFAKLRVTIHVIELAGQILPSEDADVAKILQKSLERQGVKFHLNNTIQKIVDNADSVIVTLSDGTTLETSKLLVAVGRQFQNEQWQLQLGSRGEVLVDRNYQTSSPHVWAIGDMIGQGLLAHLAMHQGIQAVRHMLGENVRPLNTVPTGIFTTPEIASVGVKQKNMTPSMSLHCFELNHLGKMQAINQNDGFIKMIVDSATKKVLGVALIGPHAVDLISEAALAIEHGLTAHDMAATIHPHPSLSEALWEVSMQAIGVPIH
jgi:dihydrolipoamide dehydrogenase